VLGADNLIVLVSETSSLWLFHALRAIVAVGLIAGLGLIGVANLRPIHLGWVIFRNLFTAFALLIYFGCLAVLPIGVVTAGLMTSPIFVLILSMIFRGQKVGVFRLAAVVIGFAGALMVVWPQDGGLTWLSIMPVMAGVFYAISAIGTRAWCEGESAWVMTLAYVAILGLFGAIGLGVLTIWPLDAPPGADGWVQRGYVTPDAVTWWVIVGQAVGSIVGVVLLTRGYQLGEASYVAVFEYAIIIFASLFAWLFWGQTLGAVALVGIVLIIASGAVIALRSSSEAP